MAKVLATHVHVQKEDGVSVILEAGSKVPDWAKDQVTNPAAYITVESDPPEAKEPKQPKGKQGAKASDGSAGGDYSTWDYPRLKAEAKNRELPQTGKIADLVQRLIEHDAENAKNPVSTSDGDGENAAAGEGDEN